MRHVLVTGGGSGIGAAVVRSCVASGARVSVFDREGADGDGSWAAVPAAQRGRWLSGDVREAVVLDRVAAELADDLDALVTCAGVSIKSPFLEATEQDWRTTLDVNVLGTAQAVRAVARMLVQQDRPGAVVTVSSTAGFGHVAGLGVHYHASKGAIVAMTRALAGELAVHRIRVNAVAPGLVRTPMTVAERERLGERALAARTPQARVLEPEHVASAVAFLLSPAAAAITGHVLPVDAGQLAVAGAPVDGYPPPSGSLPGDR